MKSPSHPLLPEGRTRPFYRRCGCGPPDAHTQVQAVAKTAPTPFEVDPSAIPQKWEVHGDLILFSEGSFADERWDPVRTILWEACTRALGANRLAIRARITNDDFRTPRVHLLIGANAIVQHVDNGVTYQFDATKCMFSAGNIREKLRVSKFKCTGEVIVDLYAGIGYFTLQYLVHTGAAFLYACEWNPAAAEALRNNLVLNRVAARCEVLQGDNAITAPTHVADRVNLGLIPTSRAGWPVAVRCLKASGGWLHVHENITDGPGQAPPEAFVAAGTLIAADLQVLLASHHGGVWTAAVRHIEPVKSYAPHITHVVYDIECRPSAGPPGALGLGGHT